MVQESSLTMIVGLGNPGAHYEHTRHNIGFLCVERLADRCGVLLGKPDPKTKARWVKTKHAEATLLLVMPQTYMNLSGESVRSIQQYYKIPTSNMLVVYDDCDLPFGHLRLRKSGGPGTHNGMKSIIQHVGTQDFPRLRLGIGTCPPQMDLADFVLSKFTLEEQLELATCLNAASACALTWLEYGLDKAMNQFNTPTPKPPKKEKQQPSVIETPADIRGGESAD